MKIGFVLDDSLDKTDGVQQYILTLGHWYGQQGHDVHYLVGETHRTDIKNMHSLSRNLQVHFNQNRMSTPLPASKQRIKELLKKEKFDVLHIQMPYSPWLAGRIIKQADSRTLIVGTFHIIPFSLLEKMATRLLGIWCRRTLLKFNAFYSVSVPAQRFMKKSFKVRSALVPNPVNLAHYKNGKQLKRYADKINIVFLGRLVERKGCGYLLEAIRQLHEQHQLDRVRVLVCGKGPLDDELKKFVRRHHLGSIVHFVGFVTEKQKIDYLATADIAVFPSTGGESFGIVLIEAMAAGSSVVLAGNNAGYRYVMAEKKEQLFDPKDVHVFSKRLRHFIISAKDRHKSAHWQEEHVRQFDVCTVGNRLLGDYQLMIAKSKNS